MPFDMPPSSHVFGAGFPLFFVRGPCSLSSVLNSSFFTFTGAARGNPVDDFDANLLLPFFAVWMEIIKL
jgi:hypothetical protein